MSVYLRVLRHGWLPFVLAVLARLPIAMAPLGIVLLVQQVRGSYASAGVVSAGYTLGSAITGPVWGRLLDRFGQPRVLVPISVLSGSFLVVLAVLAVQDRPLPVLVLLAAAVGLTFPTISAAMRGAWRVVLAADLDRRAAYALDAAAVETIFIGGPLLLSVLLVLTPQIVPLLVTAALLAGGGSAYALTPAARAWRPGSDGHGSRPSGGHPLAAPGVGAVLVVVLLIAIGFGHLDVSIPATARTALGDQARVGLLFAAIAGGSAIGGLWYGSRRWRQPERRRLPWAAGGFALGVLMVGALLGWTLGSVGAAGRSQAGSAGTAGAGRAVAGVAGADGPLLSGLVGGLPVLPVLLAVLFLAGLAISPGMIISANLIDALASADRLNEAQAWLSTAITAGASGGTALAGLLLDAGGPSWGFLAAGAALTLATVVAVAAQPRLRSARP